MEILSSKEKFLENIWGVECKYVEQVDVAGSRGYMVILYICRDCLAYTAQMLLLPYFNGGQK